MTISHFSDQKALPEPHQEADERLHGVLAHRAEEDRGAEPRHPQRRDLQAAWKKVSCGFFSPQCMTFIHKICFFSRYLYHLGKNQLWLFPQYISNIDFNIVDR